MAIKSKQELTNIDRRKARRRKLNQNQCKVKDAGKNFKLGDFEDDDNIERPKDDKPIRVYSD